MSSVRSLSMSERSASVPALSVERTVGPVVAGTVAALLDAAVVVGCASILWNGGGSTVVDGSWVSQAGCLLLASSLLLIRLALSLSIAVERVVVAIDIAVLAALVSAWGLSSRYFVGWLATYGALVLLLASLWHLLAILVTRHRVDGADGTVAALRAGCVAVALVALVVVSPIHAWSPRILSGLVVLISGAVFFAFVLRIWIRALRRVG